MNLRQTMTARSGRICAAWLIGQLMFEMDLKEPAPALAACRTVLNVLARRLSPAGMKAFEARLPRSLRPAPAVGDPPRNRGENFTLRNFFDEVDAELRLQRLNLPPGKLSRSVARWISIGVGSKDRRRLAGFLPEPLREIWPVDENQM